MKNGFTLIELLVVVLIIGVLAAVALPQYKKAVDKARVSGFIFPKLRAFYAAQAAYILANGAHTSAFSDLDVDISSGCILQSQNGGRDNVLGCNASGVAFNFYLLPGNKSIASHYKQVAFDVYYQDVLLDGQRIAPGTILCRCNASSAESREFCAMFGTPLQEGGSYYKVY